MTHKWNALISETPDKKIMVKNLFENGLSKDKLNISTSVSKNEVLYISKVYITLSSHEPFQLVDMKSQFLSLICPTTVIFFFKLLINTIQIPNPYRDGSHQNPDTSVFQRTDSRNSGIRSFSADI